MESAIDLGGVFRTVLTVVVEQFLDSNFFIDGGGKMGKVFKENYLEVTTKYVKGVETFGHILGAYVFFYNKILWPHRLDILNFFLLYDNEWTPSGDVVGGVISKAMNDTPCKLEGSGWSPIN